MNTKTLQLLNRRKALLKEKRSAITKTFQLCRESMCDNTITPSQRQVIRDILRPVVKKYDEEIKRIKLLINNEYCNGGT